MEYIKELQRKTRIKLKEKGRSNAAKANKERMQVPFDPRDLAWVHLRKEAWGFEDESFSRKGD